MTIFKRPIKKSSGIILMVVSTIFFLFVGTLYPELPLRYDIHENGHLRVFEEEGIPAARIAYNHVKAEKLTYTALKAGYQSEVFFIYRWFIVAAIAVFALAILGDSFAFFPVLWMFVSANFALWYSAENSMDVLRMAAMTAKTKEQVLADIFDGKLVFILVVAIIYTAVSIKLYLDYFSEEYPPGVKTPLYPGVKIDNSGFREEPSLWESWRRLISAKLHRAGRNSRSSSRKDGR